MKRTYRPKEKKSLNKVVKKAERAWRELELSVTSQADKKRLWDLWDGFHALDDEQAKVKGALEDLVIGFWNPNAPNGDVNGLLRRLLELIIEPANPRTPEEQGALDAIARDLKKEDRLCLKNRSTRPTAKTMRSDVLRKRASG